MATKIPTEILIKILNNVQSTQDFYSSLLVNRIWCKVTIPILWELPLNQEFISMDYKLRRKSLCIRTYISCMDTQARTLLIQNGFDLSSSPPQATFDYPSFNHKFRIDNLSYFISTYSRKIISSDQNNNCNDSNEKIIITTESRILFREICKLIINRCSFLDYFKLEEIPKRHLLKNLKYHKIISPIIKLPGASKVFKKLKSFTLTLRNDEIIESLTLICDNILNMDLKFTSVRLLTKFINVQKSLENLSICHVGCNSLLWAIISQKETLKTLRFNEVNFFHFEGKSPIRQFISLQELYLINCHGLHNSIYLPLASSFTQLSSFHYIHHKYQPNRAHEFIIKVLETANTNLKNIYLNLYSSIPSDIISAILNYCTKITELTLCFISFEHVIEIFNNFNELRRFSINCGERLNYYGDEFLCQIAENVPESLETFEIRIKVFSADSLRKFSEGWCRKAGGRNKKIIVKNELGLFRLSDEHLKVIEEYGIQFDIKYDILI